MECGRLYSNVPLQCLWLYVQQQLKEFGALGEPQGRAAAPSIGEELLVVWACYKDAPWPTPIGVPPSCGRRPQGQTQDKLEGCISQLAWYGQGIPQRKMESLTRKQTNDTADERDLWEKRLIQVICVKRGGLSYFPWEIIVLRTKSKLWAIGFLL